jgi:hypothetical protein
MAKKKQKELKTLDERQAIVQKIRKTFEEHGISLQAFQSLSPLEVALNEYESNDALLSGFSGRFYIPEISRYLEYRLPIAKQTPDFLKISTS